MDLLKDLGPEPLDKFLVPKPYEADQILHLFSGHAFIERFYVLTRTLHDGLPRPPWSKDENAKSREWPANADLYTQQMVPRNPDIRARIVSLVKPWKYACSMDADILAPYRYAGVAIIKLYDWRFATEPRRCQKLVPWGDDNQRDFVRVALPSHQESIDAIKDQALGNAHWLHRRPNDRRLWMCYMSRAYSLRENFAYLKLKSLQGKHIPEAIASCFYYMVAPECQSLKFAALAEVNREFYISGFITKKVNGFNITQLVGRVPKESWQGIVDQALDVMRQINMLDAFWPWPQLDNIMVCRDSRERGGYRVVMHGFSHLYTRIGEKSWSWWYAIWRSDGINRLALLLGWLTRKLGHEVQICRSDLWDRWVDYVDRDRLYPYPDYRWADEEMDPDFRQYRLRKLVEWGVKKEGDADFELDRSDKDWWVSKEEEEKVKIMVEMLRRTPKRRKRNHSPDSDINVTEWRAEDKDEDVEKIPLALTPWLKPEWLSQF
ncbi:hypothetical protein EJ06DRAFT_579525 [Trichodelitschia bisporula]|uniref:Uncharacterized protein n=1 Tax=Trichodelitschia bisporula TaxID=703511 RepID=A0A6G1I5I3_9PEZI|nr:hypothetical protein EJ06DRAFT_579525 [Trichodelitschia bisporula]